MKSTLKTPSKTNIRAILDTDDYLDYEDVQLAGLMLANDTDEVICGLQDLFEKSAAAKKIVIRGSIGRWNGTVHGFSTFEDVRKAIQFCLNDLDSWKFADEDDAFCINGYHHDGSNSYELRFLSEKGCQILEDWEYGESEDYDALPEGEVMRKLWDAYSETPGYAEHFYGPLYQ